MTFPAQHGGVLKHLLEYKVAVAEGVRQLAPGLQVCALVPAQLIEHGKHDLVRTFKAVYGRFNTRAVNQGHPTIVGIVYRRFPMRRLMGRLRPGSRAKW